MDRERKRELASLTDGAPLRDVVEALRSARRRGDRVVLSRCLELLLAAWGARPNPVLGRAIASLGEVLEGPVAAQVREAGGKKAKSGGKTGKDKKKKAKKSGKKR